MKCSKCGYLGFEAGERCRNCGYEFSLVSAADAPPVADVILDRAEEHARPPLDLDRLIGAEDPAPSVDLPLFSPAPAPALREAPRADAVPAYSTGPAAPSTSRVSRAAAEDAPLIGPPARPRAPLGVRRPTQEVPRARSAVQPRQTPQPDTLFDVASPREAGAPARPDAQDDPLAPLTSRVLAALIDVSLLLVMDVIVLWFTLRLLGLSSMSEVFDLPALPLAAFLLLLNGGYLVAFTAVGGQSIGKMAFGIKVVARENGSVPIGRATVRAVAYLASAIPFGAGFLPGVVSVDGLALHDRLAQTRVVRLSST